MALAAATLSNGGERVAARLAMAVNIPNSGWVMLPANEEAERVFLENAANQTADSLADSKLPIWQVVSTVEEGVGNSVDTNSGYSWYIGGTLPEWSGVPLAIAVVLEENDPKRVLAIGQSMLQSSMQP